jgi:hypothetical protein
MRDQQLLTIGCFSVIACALIFVIISRESFIQDSTPAKTAPTSSQEKSMFAEMKCDISCCDKNSYSCSTGCVCLSDNQHKQLETRGNNASHRDFLSG